MRLGIVLEQCCGMTLTFRRRCPVITPVTTSGTNPILSHCEFCSARQIIGVKAVPCLGCVMMLQGAINVFVAQVSREVFLCIQRGWQKEDFPGMYLGGK